MEYECIAWGFGLIAYLWRGWTERLCALQQKDEVLLVLPRYIGNEEWEGIILLLARFIIAMHDDVVIDNATAALMVMLLRSLISHALPPLDGAPQSPHQAR